MINTSKQGDYLDPISDITHPIHIIGLGAIGSTIATMLTRMGCPKLHLYDFDTVESKNVCNQDYFDSDIGKTKLEALTAQLKNINPSVEIIEYPKGYEETTKLTGHIFLCVDNIDLRRAIVEANKGNPYIISISDFRMRLTDAQHYMCDTEHINYMLSTMQFTHEEAVAETPISACGTSLNVITTVKTICALGIQNFINMIKLNTYKKCILIDLKESLIDFID